jgi:hypothetical protein
MAIRITTPADRERERDAKVAEAARRRRLQFVSVGVPLAIAPILYYVGQYGPAESRFISNGAALASFIIGILVLVMTYLQTGFVTSIESTASSLRSSLSRRTDTDPEVAALRQEVMALHAQVDAAQEEFSGMLDAGKQMVDVSNQIGDEQKAELIASFKAQLLTDAADEVLEKIKAEAAVLAKRDVRDAELRHLFELSKRRLEAELASLGYRGNLNLTLGGGTTLIGLILLGWTVFREPTPPVSDPWALGLHFAQRFTLVVFVELFAFFFLSLYKTTLGEIKYFQNELTNVESKQIALRTAVDQGDQSMVKAAVTALAATERNHILNKDQTTVDLEKAKIERLGTGDIVKALSELLKKADK